MSALFLCTRDCLFKKQSFVNVTFCVGPLGESRRGGGVSGHHPLLLLGGFSSPSRAVPTIIPERKSSRRAIEKNVTRLLVTFGQCHACNVTLLVCRARRNAKI